jgi:hypothetical protein
VTQKQSAMGWVLESFPVKERGIQKESVKESVKLLG